MERFDIAIIGTGPAGLEAAITAKNRNKNIILFGDKKLSSKVGKFEEISNYLGVGKLTGQELISAFQNHLSLLDIEVTEDKVQSVYAIGNYFIIQGKEVMYEASTVILATGVVMAKPLKGEEEFLGRGVSYCATCDAPLYKGKTAIVVGYSPCEEEEANFLSEVAEKVYYLPTYKDEVHLNDKVELISGRPLEIRRENDVSILVTSEKEYSADGVFVLREQVFASRLVPGLTTDGAHVVVNRKQETNLPGLYAAGDITGLPYQVAKSVGEGSVAALQAVSYLSKLK
jgi:thioredoxin reductase (NADPH)